MLSSAASVFGSGSPPPAHPGSLVATASAIPPTCEVAPEEDADFEVGEAPVGRQGPLQVRIKCQLNVLHGLRQPQLRREGPRQAVLVEKQRAQRGWQRPVSPQRALQLVIGQVKPGKVGRGVPGEVACQCVEGEVQLLQAPKQGAGVRGKLSSCGTVSQESFSETRTVTRAWLLASSVATHEAASVSRVVVTSSLACWKACKPAGHI